MNPLSRSALEHLSLVTYIKEGVLARDFYIEATNEPLVYDQNLYEGQVRTDYVIVDPIASSFGKLATTKGRGWLSFDLTEKNTALIYEESSGYVTTFDTPFHNFSFGVPLIRESNYIIVRDQLNNIMDRSWYQIDYEGGRVRFPSPTTPSGVVISGIKPTTLDYKFHSISVLDGWPDAENIPTLPIVCIYPESESLDGIQLGGGVKFIGEYIIDVFATSSSERRNILDSLRNGLYNKHCSVIDFNRCGFPLKQHGVINDSFIQIIQYNGKSFQTYLTLNPGNGHLLYFVDIEVLYDISPVDVITSSMKYRGRIKLTTKTYSDRDPDLVGRYVTVEPVGGFDSLIQRGYSI